MIFAIRREEILALWPEIGPHIERTLSIDVNPPTLDEVLAGIARGSSCCLVDATEDGRKIRAVAVFYINQRREVIGEYMAGDDVGEWVGDMYEAVNEFARRNGCKVIRSWARKGWARIAKKYGYADQGISMFAKVLDD